MTVEISNDIDFLEDSFIEDIGLVPSENCFNYSEIQDSLKLLKGHVFFEKIEINVKEIIVIDNNSAFSSASFPNHNTKIFLSEYAFYILPPNYVTERSKYSMLENIYHEALHLELYKIEAKHALTHGDESIVIEWKWNNRKTDLISSIHALYVYLHLIELRENFGFIEYCPKAIDNATFLYDVISKYSHLVFPQFLNELDCLFRKVIYSQEK